MFTINNSNYNSRYVHKQQIRNTNMVAEIIAAKIAQKNIHAVHVYSTVLQWHKFAIVKPGADSQTTFFGKSLSVLSLVAAHNKSQLAIYLNSHNPILIMILLMPTKSIDSSILHQKYNMEKNLVIKLVISYFY